MNLLKQSVAALLLLSSVAANSQENPATPKKAPVANPENQPAQPQDRATTSSSSVQIQNVQPQDVKVGPALAQGATTASRPVNFPPTPVPKPPTVPLTQEQIDSILLPKQVLNETSNVLSVMYNGFRRSQVDPCGCVTQQLGGIDKEANLHKRIDELKLPVLRLDAGGYLRDMPDDNHINSTRYLLKALGALKIDAANVGFTDLGAGVDKLKEFAKSGGIELVSANVQGPDGKLLFPPYIIKDVNLKDAPLKVGIIGVTRPRVPVQKNTSATQTAVPAPPAPGAAGGFTITDASEALLKYVPELNEKVDAVFVLSYDRREKTADLLKPLADKGKVDVVIAGEYLQAQGHILDVNGARTVSVGYEGRQMGHLVIAIDGKDFGAAANQFIEIVQGIPSVAEISKIVAQSKSKVAKPQATPAKAKLDLGKE